MTVPQSNASYWQRWLNFWFAPTDPSTMAFIRIVAGLLVVYIHLCYTYDLHSFFGKSAWYDLETANRERREAPTRPPALDWEWNDRIKSAAVPEEPHRRNAVMDWLRALPQDKAELRKKLRLLDARGAMSENRGNGYSEETIRTAAAYLFTLGPDPAVRKGRLDALVTKSLRDDKEQFPEALDLGLEQERKLLARDLEELASTLPGTMTTSVDERRYITNYLLELAPVLRDNLVKFVRDLPADDAKRLEAIDYLGYWNYDRRKAYTIGHPTFSFWFHVTDPTEMALAHAAVLVVLLMFTFGLFTRVTAILTWFAAASYLHRNQQVLFGQDTMMNILLIYLMIANCGATFSLDRLINRYRAARASLGRSGTIDGATQRYLAVAPPSPSCGFAQRLLQIHFCFIYAASGLSKLKGDGWWNHTAYWDTLVNPEFTMIHYGWYQDMVRTLAASRPVYSVMAAVGVYFTLFTEITLPFVIWTRLRPYWIMLGCGLHLGIGVFMGLLVFSLLMMTMLVSFLPGSMILAQFTGSRPTRRSTFRFNSRSPQQSRAAALIVAADLAGAVDCVDVAAIEPGTIQPVKWSMPGQPDATGPDASNAAFGTVGVLKWIRPLTYVPGLGAKLTGLIAGT